MGKMFACVPGVKQFAGSLSKEAFHLEINSFVSEEFIDGQSVFKVESNI